MSETGQNIRALPESTLAIAWPKIAADIARIRDRHFLLPGIPESKLTKVDRLTCGESALVSASIADRLVATACKRRPGATYVQHHKTLTLIVIERTA